MTTRSYDAVVIGGGPGGYVAAIRLAQLGRKTALVERNALGGACLNWGCIPSKALIAAADLVEGVRAAAARGILAAPELDVAKLRQFKSDVVRKLATGIAQLEKANGVDILDGQARFVSPRCVEVSGAHGTSRVEAAAFVVATGARQVELGHLPFGGDVWSAREALELTEVPRRLAVVGGGVIGLEIGTAYAKLGSDVTVIERLPRLLDGIDADAARAVTNGLRRRGVRVLLEADAGALATTVPTGVAVVARLAGKEVRVECDKLLVTVGFRSHEDALGLERLGVRFGHDGFVMADRQCRTSVPWIFAVGDVTGPPFLAHRASRQAEIAAEVIGGRPAPRTWAAIPAAVFTDPEIGQVGLSEEQARRAGSDPVTGKFSFAALGRAIAIDRPDGFVKVVADRSSERILGATFCGPEASELVAEATLAIEMGATLRDVAHAVHAHPTLAEAFMEACKAARGEAIHAVNRPRRSPGEAASAEIAAST